MEYNSSRIIINNIKFNLYVVEYVNNDCKGYKL